MSCCVQDLRLKTLAVQPPFTVAECHIVKDEDWIDPLPQFLEVEGEPTNLTGKVIEIYIRPVYDHSILIAKLSTEDATIIVDDALNGMSSVNVTREFVIANIPVGRWDHFCIQIEPATADPADGLVRLERYRGPLTVHPGRV